MEDALTGRVIAARGEVLRKVHKLKDAQFGRDALAKVEYTFFYFTVENLVTFSRKDWLIIFSSKCSERLFYHPLYI